MHIIVRLILLLAVGVCFLNQLSAQKISFGFKAGANYSTILGDSEISTSGDKLEKATYTFGFHTGAIAQVGFTKKFGLRTELLYSQKGGRYEYNGEGYFIFQRYENPIIMEGPKRVILTTTNTYIDLPIMAYYRLLNNKIEVSAGINLGFLVGSKATGRTAFFNDTLDGAFIRILDYDYNRDEAQEMKTENTLGHYIKPNILIREPESYGAYYDFDKKDGNFYNIFDVGLNLGVAYVFKSGLTIGGRVNYGLTDISNNYYDRSYYKLDNNNQVISRTDKDINFLYQAYISFSF